MNKQTAEEIVDKLAGLHPGAGTELKFENNFELLVAVILSAQCTDKRVNAVTAELFKVAKTPEQFVAMPAEELERRIFSCGFYKNKAKNIKAMSEDLIKNHGGQVPADFDALLALPGVGRKTANVVYAVGFGGAGMAVDTHVFRVANRLGLVSAKTPEETEKQLCALLPKAEWSAAHHYILFHGRYICKSQHPLCEKCNLEDYCVYRQSKNNR